jgi:hypothetical protein
MSNYLSVELTRYVERRQLTAVQVERAAGLPNATLARIHTGRHPRPETMSALLASVPQPDAELLLLAYLRDDCPDDWEQRIHLEIMPAGSLAEPASTYQAPHAQNGAAKPQIDRALAALTQAAAGDTDLRDWLIQTAHILRLIP